MEDKIVEGNFTATPEPVSEVKEEIVPSQAQLFLGRLFEFVHAAMQEYKDFPLNNLLNTLNTVALAYLVSTDNVEEQRKFLEWTYKASLVEIDRIEKLKAEKKASELASEQPIILPVD